MENAPEKTTIETSNAVQDVSTKPSPQDDDVKPDYSSKATTKTTMTDYLVVFCSERRGKY